jgi:Na+/H+ antiporter NhaD/arsenite permease-like protein
LSAARRQQQQEVSPHYYKIDFTEESMITRNKVVAFVKDEWLFLIAALGLVFTSAYLHRVPSYSRSDLEILYILFILFVITNGLQRHGVISGIARKLERGHFVASKMVITTFFLSMFVTNDVALISIVPLTMMLNINNIEWLIVLEALAANAGSALSPFGNPQNLYIYWFYKVPFVEFATTIIPFSALFLLFLLIGALLINSNKINHKYPAQEQLKTPAYIYLGMLIIFVFAVLRLLPLVIGLGVILYVIIFDRRSMKVDYFLLATFACFFGFTDNLQIILSGVLAHPHHVFLLAVGLSQVISNVPTALLLADFTAHWKSLLWGVSVGGFGTLVASLANLIAYRLYVRQEKQRALPFAKKFHLLSFLALGMGILLYYLLYVMG